MVQIFTALYLLAMLAAGWRLHGIAWSRPAKWATALALVCPLPLLIVLPGLLHPDRPFAGLRQSMGVALLVCGALCLGGGWSAAWLRARRK